MKSANEIKKGLECCSEDDCKKCPYWEDCNMADGFSELAGDALALIQQLQDDLQLEKKRTDALAMELAALKNAKKQLEDHLREATKKVEQLEAERDALLKYITDSTWAACDICKHGIDGASVMDCKHIREVGVPCFEWRGIQKEE